MLEATSRSSRQLSLSRIWEEGGAGGDTQASENTSEMSNSSPDPFLLHFTAVTM